MTRITACILVLALLLPAGAASAAELLLQNDGWIAGPAGFQGGFVAGEIGASRFLAPGPFPMQLNRVQFLFGGSTDTETITLRVYDDSAGTIAPGAEIFSGQYQVTGSDVAIQEVNLVADNVFVSDDFRVGIEFTHSGVPSIARDTDGNINAPLNYIFAQGLGWVQSNLLGLTGDWIIRAYVEEAVASTFTVGGNVSGLNGTLTLQNNGGDDLVLNADGPFTFATALSDGAPYNVTVLSAPAGQSCVVSNGSGNIAGANVTNVSVACSDVPGGAEELQNDGFTTGQAVSFQAGFVTDEIAASRFTPSLPSTIQSVRFLFGGAAATTTVGLRIWDDTGALDPGTLLLSRDYLVTASDTVLQEIDISADDIQVSGSFRVGLEFQSNGLPSIAADTDGNIDANANLIYTTVPAQWHLSQTLGLTGDWILRAVVLPEGAGAPQILNVEDVGNDQGKQVRVEFARSDQDQAGAATPVLGYEAYRRIDPLPAPGGSWGDVLDPGKLAGWDFVGQIPAHGDDEYSFIAPTLADSTVTDGMHWSVFLVRATTALPTTFFQSEPDSGYSLDNLAPSVPLNFVSGGAQLTWDPAPEPDFAYFTVYGSSNGLRDGSETELTDTVATAYNLGGASFNYYLLTATDFSGNEGLAALIDNVTAVDPVPSATLGLEVYPNPFNPGTSIRFGLAAAGPVTMRVYDARGRHVETLLDRAFIGAGSHEVAYRTELASGTYFLRLDAGGRIQTEKMTILR